MSTAAPGQHDVVAGFTAATSSLLGATRRLACRRPRRPGEPSPTELRILAHLRDSDEPVAVGELARTVDLTPATMTTTVDRLEAEGAVARDRSSEDRRVVLVSLSARGHEILASRRAQWIEQWATALRDVDPAELELATRTLRRVSAILDEL